MRYADEINYRFLQLMSRDPFLQPRFDKVTPENAAQLFEDEWIRMSEHVWHKWQVSSWEIPLEQPFKIVSVEIAQPKVSLFKRWRKEVVGKTESLEEDEEGDLFQPAPGHLYVDIDLRTLDLNDAREVKKQVWEIVKTHLLKGRQENESPLLPKELRFVYHCGEETFRNYLRWYDLHIGTDYQTPNGFSFRAIACCESVLRDRPEEYEDAKKMVANRTKVVHSRKGEWVLKGVVGAPVKGEDAVEKGVKAIYGAIHGKPYPLRKTKQEDYDCPTHGNSCPKGCSYMKEFMKEFNRRHMLFKPLFTMDPAKLSARAR
jgi:hypothetical protein